MEKLATPFGDIDVLIDEKPIPYTVQKGSANDVVWPNIRHRYQIVILFIPDGKEHSLSCVFSPNCSYDRTPESGECLECQSFYSPQRIKMSIGIECETGYSDGKRVSDKYDYDADYLDNGMVYRILSDTKTERYVFGIAWIDDVGRDDKVDNNRGVQTWFAADPTFRL